MPILWNLRSSHLLGKNLNPSRQILSSALKKFENEKSDLIMINGVFREQERQGII